MPHFYTETHSPTPSLNMLNPKRCCFAICRTSSEPWNLHLTFNLQVILLTGELLKARLIPQPGNPLQAKSNPMLAACPEFPPYLVADANICNENFKPIESDNFAHCSQKPGFGSTQR